MSGVTANQLKLPCPTPDDCVVYAFIFTVAQGNKILRNTTRSAGKDARTQTLGTMYTSGSQMVGRDPIWGNGANLRG